MHKLYLDPFMDMCNGEILSYGIDQRPSAKNVMDALDKAIEACDKILDDSKDKYISVNVTYINSFCFIKIENSKINEINIKNNNFITNKKDKFMHGIGLKNIKDTVYKYNGEIKIEFDDDKFVIKFIFSLKN